VKTRGGICPDCDSWLDGLAEAIDHLVDGHGVSVWKIWVREHPRKPGYQVGWRRC